MDNLKSKISDINKLIKQCEQSSLSSFAYQDSTFSIQFSKVTDEAVCNIKMFHKKNMKHIGENKLNNTENSIDEISITQSSQDEMNENSITITSPFVGTVEFSNYIKLGNGEIHINKGDIICSIEAMKIYNDIKSPVTGTITDILVKDCSLVEYDQPIVKIRNDKDE